MDNDNLSERYSYYAWRILNETKTKILFDMRYLAMSIMKLNKVKEIEPISSLDGSLGFNSIMTNGNDIVYTAKFIVDRWKYGSITQSARDFLHILLHCVLKHMFMHAVDPEIWDIACDMAVENIICEMKLPGVYTKTTSLMMNELNQIKREIPLLNAESIYKYLLPKANNRVLIDKLKQLFKVDEHFIWYIKAYKVKYKDMDAIIVADKNDDIGKGISKPTNQPQQDPDQDQKSKNKGEQDQDQNQKSKNKGKQGQDSKTGENQDQGQDQNQGQDEQEDGSGDESEQQGDNGLQILTGKAAKELEDFIGANYIDDNEKEWGNISKSLLTDIQTFSKNQLQGTGAGSLIQNLERVNREKYDYTAFLKKFSTLQEVMKVSEDEYDYIFYTYGLNKYGNMPLIEPLEYKDDKVIRDFVIAIDTSGSVQGEIVQTFLNKTYNILKSSESFNKKVNIHIIQCDAQIQQDTKITSLQDLETFFANLQLHGFGGTDFRPVFEYVAKLREEKELTNLKGLIYFTDGYGIFPQQKTDYDTAFVFIDQRNYDSVQVPSWAIKILLDSDDIKGMK